MAEPRGREHGGDMSSRTWGYWTEQKLEMLAEYLPRFTTASHRAGKTIYLDLFAGDTTNISRTSGDVIEGSPRIALRTNPPFSVVRLFELPRQAARLQAELQSEFPGRDLRVVPGNCNQTIHQVLSELRAASWAPTFALVDQYAAEVSWSTLKALADFKRGRKFKVEMWLLFAHGMLPRALGGDDLDAALRYSNRVTDMFGDDSWLQAYYAWQRGLLSPTDFREELANLMRWRLEHALGYKVTHEFEMKNTVGSPIYRMIFATDNEAGDRIMSHIYGTAAAKRPKMQAEARAAAQAVREAQGKVTQPGLFDPLPRAVKDVALYVHEPPHPPYELPDSESP